jgi:hypothetical protein
MSVLILTKIIFLLRWGVGLTVLAAAWLLKEDEEGKITNWLEEKRKAIAAIRDKELSKTTIYLQSLASITSGLLAKVFGKRMLSTQAVFISILLSSISLITLVLVGAAIEPPEPVFGKDWVPSTIEEAETLHHEEALRQRDKTISIIAMSVFDAVLIICAAACVRYYSSKLLKIAQYVFFAAAFTVAAYVGSRYVRDAESVFSFAEFILGAFLSIGMDIGFILVMRWMFARLDQANNVKTITFISLTNVLLLAIIVGTTVYPLLYVRHQYALDESRNPLLAAGGSPDLRREIASVIAFAAASCGLDAVLSMVIVILCAGISLNSLVWSFVERNFYSLNRYKIVTNKKLMWSAGLAICGESHLLALAVKAVKAGWF